MCSNVKTLNQFKAKSILRYEEREIHIEEIQLDNRGKLTVTENGQTHDVYFEKSKDGINIAHYERKSKN